MSANLPPSTPPGIPHDDNALRPHSFDGIQEYDKRLPNWWLFTLYGAIVFSIIYWLYYQLTGVGPTERAVFKQEMDALQAARLASAVGELTDAQLWEYTRNADVVAAGKATFAMNCVACHRASLRGKEEDPAAQGPSLVDAVWIHGGQPSQVRTTITKGVLEKGMQSWGPILGDKRVIELVAYVMSHHQPPPAGAAP
jgi:cytochrome c oxidase cbb3-type subunit III